MEELKNKIMEMVNNMSLKQLEFIYAFINKLFND